MEKEKNIYRYRVPVREIMVSIICFPLSFVFMIAFVGSDTILRIILLFFIIFILSFGIGLLIMYLKNIKNKYIELTPESIRIPERWTKNCSEVKFANIVHIVIVEAYDDIIEIYTIDESEYYIERNWMKSKKEFQQLFKYLSSVVDVQE